METLARQCLITGLHGLTQTTSFSLWQKLNMPIQPIICSCMHLVRHLSSSQQLSFFPPQKVQYGYIHQSSPVIRHYHARVSTSSFYFCFHSRFHYLLPFPFPFSAFPYALLQATSWKVCKFDMSQQIEVRTASPILPHCTLYSEITQMSKPCNMHMQTLTSTV